MSDDIEECTCVDCRLDRACVDLERARRIAVSMEQQLADLAELHESWGNTDPDDLNQQLLWEDFERVLNRAVTE